MRRRYPGDDAYDAPRAELSRLLQLDTSDWTAIRVVREMVVWKRREQSATSEPARQYYSSLIETARQCMSVNRFHCCVWELRRRGVEIPKFLRF